VADEDRRTVQAISTMCQIAGHELHVTTSGADVASLALQLQPTLIVLALQLPDADGRDVLRDLKKDSRLAQIPVLVCSGRDYESDRAISLEHGAIEYVATNVWSLRHVLARIEDLLARAQRPRA
jgi:two-component system, OmpR family, KDP operon response regulator KdpE